MRCKLVLRPANKAARAPACGQAADIAELKERQHLLLQLTAQMQRPWGGGPGATSITGRSGFG